MWPVLQLVRAPPSTSACKRVESLLAMDPKIHKPQVRLFSRQSQLLFKRANVPTCTCCYVCTAYSRAVEAN